MSEQQIIGVAPRCEVWWHLLSCQHTTPVPDQTPPPLSAGRQQGTAVQPAISTQVQLKPSLFQLTHLTPPEIYSPVGIDCFYSFKTSNCNCSEPIGFKGLPDLTSKPCESAELCQKKKRKSITQISNSWLNRVSTKVNKFYCETWNQVTFAWVHSKISVQHQLLVAVL